MMVVDTGGYSTGPTKGEGHAHTSFVDRAFVGSEGRISRTVVRGPAIVGEEEYQSLLVEFQIIERPRTRPTPSSTALTMAA